MTVESVKSDYSDQDLTNDENSDQESDTAWDEDELGFAQLTQRAYTKNDDMYGDQFSTLLKENENISEDAARREANATVYYIQNIETH